MKKIVINKLSLFVLTFILGIIFSTKIVFADSYPITCGLYEVSRVNDDGSLSKVECYNDISSARNKMKENSDYVVRSSKSLSPTKIVDMNAGIVYTYPYRANSLTQSVYNKLDSNLNGTGAKTYLTIHYPMEYLGNRYYDEKPGYSRGWVHVNCHGFDGYADLEYVDFVPYKYIEKGIPITLGGNDKTYRNEQPFKVVCKANTYEAVRNGNYIDLVFTFYRGWSKNTDGGVGISASLKIGKAPDFMQQGVKYYSNDGVNFYSDIRLTKLVGTYYNYYQYVPFRTKSNISGSTLDSYLNSKKSNANTTQIYNRGNEFKNNESIYGCNAVLTYSMAIHESAWGTSALSYSHNNLFGYGAFDSNVDLAHKYNSISDCIAAQMADNLANYMDVKCGSYYSMSLGNKGGGFMTRYASDPYWAEEIAQYYYDIDKFNNNYNGNLTDYNSYQLALVNTYNVDVKREANGNSQTLYKTANKNGYQKNLITVIYDSTNDYTKVQLSNALDNNNNVINPITLPAGTLVTYDFARSVGYIQTSNLVLINSASNNDVPQEPKEKEDNPAKMEPMVAIENLTLNGNTITISGIGLITNCNFNDLSKVKHEFLIKNLETGNEATFDLTSKEYPNFGLNDGYTYKYIGFEGTVDLTEVINGSFRMMIRIGNGEYVKEKDICNNDFSFYNLTSKVANTTNRISSNSRYNYRLELEISNTPLDYSKINVVNNRPSLFSFDNLTINEDLDLHIDGQAFIYYTNYNNAQDVTYKAYLIKDAEHYKELNTQKTTCSLDYTSLLKSKYDLSNICYEVDDNISDLEDGEYKMILAIEKKDGNNTYIDYVEMNNLGDATLPSVEKDSKIYELIESEVRERIMLDIKEAEVQDEVE